MLKCDLHDYIEIICLYRYKVELTMLDESVVKGQFHDTGFVITEGKKTEVIKGLMLQSNAASNIELNIDINNIKSLIVISPDPVFTYVNFTP